MNDVCMRRLSQQRHRMMRETVLGIEVDIDRLLPLILGDFFNTGGGPGDAGVVDQHIEAVGPLPLNLKHPLDLGRAGNISLGGERLRVTLTKGLHRLLADITHMHLGPGLQIGRRTPTQQ